MIYIVAESSLSKEFILSKNIIMRFHCAGPWGLKDKLGTGHCPQGAQSNIRDEIRIYRTTVQDNMLYRGIEFQRWKN